MTQISVAEASEDLQAVLEQVARGEEVILLQEGRKVARVVPPPAQTKRLPSRKERRASIQVKGEPLSQTAIRMREEARY